MIPLVQPQPTDRYRAYGWSNFVFALAGSPDLTGPPPWPAGAGLAGIVDLLEDVDYLAGASAVGREGLVVFVRADLLREEEAAGVADDGVRRHVEDDGERLDPA